MSTAVVFPGQGSQFVGMGRDFYDKYETVKDYFTRADKALGYNLSEIMFNGPEDELRLTQNTQPALVTMSAGIWSLIKDKIEVSYFAGHSLGEYSAVYASGGLSFEDTVKAVHNRGKFMQSAVPVGVGAMSAVLGLDDDKVAEICSGISKDGYIVEPANFNCPGQVVIAGNSDAVSFAGEELKKAGAKRVVPLPVSAPFHCSLMKPAKDAMEKYLENIEIKDLSIPVINNIDAVVETSSSDVRDALIRQVAGTVQWTKIIKKMAELGVTRIIEVGAGSVLTGLIKKIDKDIEVFNISSVSDLEKI